MKTATISVSQAENYRACKRKWFFSSVDYLPQEPRRSTAIGDCLHGVLERYLDVDEHGLKNGKPPELYPPDWYVQKDYFGKKVLFVLDIEEQDTIKVLVEKAISEGKIIRRPNAITEYKEKVHLFPELTIQVRIDYAYDWTIEDHKSCKDFRYTLVEDEKHARYIGKDSQLLLYGYFWCKKREREGHTIPEYITVQHNQFCVGADSPRIEQPKTKVPFTACVAEYKAIVKVAEEQLELRKKAHSKEIKWTAVEKDIDACSSYGGCPYKKVCVCQESVTTYKTRVKKILDEMQIKLEGEKDNMGFNLKRSGATASQESVLAEIDGTVETAPTASAPTAPTTEAWPTTVEGFNEAQQKLVACAELLGSPVDDIVKLPKFIALQEAKEKLEDEIKQAEAKAKAEAVKKAKAEAKAKEVAEAKVEPTVEPNVEPTVEPVQEEVDFSIKKPVKSRSKDLVVCIKCYPVGGKAVDTITLHEVFAKKSAELAHASNVSSYYDLDPFKRRDMFARASEGIAKELEGFHLLVTCYGPDELALLNAILMTGPTQYSNGQ